MNPIHKTIVLANLAALLVSCSMLTDLAMNAVSGEKGGINTELVVGDKEQVLGTNQEVDAKQVGKVVGTSDNSVVASNAKEVKVINNTFPVWAIGIFILLAMLVGWLAPRPALWKRMIKGKPNE